MSSSRKERSSLHDDAEPTLGERAAELTHDLTNALGALTLRLDMLGKDPDCTTAQSEHIEAIRGICAVATARVGQLHDFVWESVTRKRSC